MAALFKGEIQMEIRANLKWQTIVDRLNKKSKQNSQSLNKFRYDPSYRKIYMFDGSAYILISNCVDKQEFIDMIEPI